MCTLWRPGGLVFNAPINFDEIVCNNKRAISTNWSPQLTHPRSWVSSLRKQLLIAVVIPAKTYAAPHTWEHWRLFGRGSGYSECICSVCLWVRSSWGTFRGHWKIRGWAAGFCRAGAVDVAPGRRKPCAYSHPKFSTVIVLDLDRAWKECRIQAASPEPGDKWGACRCLQPSCAVPVLRAPWALCAPHLPSVQHLLAPCRATLGTMLWCPVQEILMDILEGLKTVPTYQAHECLLPLSSSRETEVLQQLLVPTWTSLKVMLAWGLQWCLMQTSGEQGQSGDVP